MTAEWSDLLQYLGPEELAEIDDILNCPAMMAWQEEERSKSDAELTEWRAAEMERCREDIVYWIRQFCITYDPRLPLPYLPFDLYPRQEEFLGWLEGREGAQKAGLVEKSRDSGVSYLCTDFALHRWLFRAGYSVGFGSYKLEKVDVLGDPDSLFEKMRITLRNLPHWMLPAGWNQERHCLHCRIINPANGSTITGETGDNIGRGGRKSAYFIDEAAFLDHFRRAQASLSHNTPFKIWVSTPNGLNDFYKLRQRTDMFSFHWHSDPRKNAYQILLAGNVVGSGTGECDDLPRGAKVIYPWYEALEDPPEVRAQEVDIDYLGTGAPCFDRKYLSKVLQRISQEVYGPEIVEEPGASAWAATVKTYVEADVAGEYLIVADVAEGLDAEGDHDYSVAHVYDLESWEQVCHYRGRPDTHNFGVDLATLGEMYNMALVAVERTGPGLSTLNSLETHCFYPNIYSHREFDEIGSPKETMRPGYPATVKTKKQTKDDLASIIRDMAKGEEGFLWREPNTVEEMIHFVNLPNFKCGAEVGTHDDEVTCCRMAAQLMPMFTTRRQIRVEQFEETRVSYGERRMR